MATVSRQKSYIDGPASGIRFSVEMPWIPFPGIEGSHFKLLRLDRETDGGISLLRIQPAAKGRRPRPSASSEDSNPTGTLNFATVSLSPAAYATYAGGCTHG